jgi:hypothetical protein
MESKPSKPQSKWDQTEVFGWATPAPNINGTVPEPWRVAHDDRALAWLKGLFRFTDLFTYDLYVTYESKEFRGKKQLLVGLRDNRNSQLHQSRIESMFTSLQKQGYPVRMPGDSFLFLVDDINQDGQGR